MTFERDCVELALDKLFNKSKHFCIVSARNIGDIVGVSIEKHPNYKLLHGLHCVNYCDMPDRVRHELPNKLMGMFRPDTVNVSCMADLLTCEGKHMPPIEDVYLEESTKVKKLRFRNK